jgi:hypothetical protein
LRLDEPDVGAACAFKRQKRDARDGEQFRKIVGTMVIRADNRFSQGISSSSRHCEPWDPDILDPAEGVLGLLETPLHASEIVCPLLCWLFRRIIHPFLPLGQLLSVHFSSYLPRSTGLPLTVWKEKAPGAVHAQARPASDCWPSLMPPVFTLLLSGLQNLTQRS